MGNFKNIQDKLHDFISKYYTNEIIKGSIFFLLFGLLYFIFTLFIEYFLWLRPVARTFLFWIFILVEFGLLLKFILFPIFKLIGLQRGISQEMASKIIGKHFNEIDDKLLNLLQLNESKTHTDLLLASIEQKSTELQPIPFKNAIDFRINFHYLKYLAIPITIFGIIYFSGNNYIFKDSLTRVVNHNTAYLPLAPFEFHILNDELVAIEGVPFMLQVTTLGDVKPDDIKIIFNKEVYYLNNNKSVHEFFYEFVQPSKSFQFYLESNEVVSKKYQVEVIKTPKIINIEMYLKYPPYIFKEDETIQNTGNAIVPEGTKVIWNISTEHTLNIDLTTTEINTKNTTKSLIEALQTDNYGNYRLTKTLGNTIDYEVSTSNSDLKNYEVLSYRLGVIKDLYPKIFIRSDIDSVSRGPVNFVGQIRDDHGISHLQVLAKNTIENSLSIYNIDTGHSDFEEFFYTFPEGISLEEGVSYEIFFQVFDNDGINGPKRSKSQTFYYKNKTNQEIEEELLKEQKQNLEEMQNESKNYKELQKALIKFSDELKTKNKTDWNDEKQLENFIDRQNAYQKLMNKNKENILRNMNESERPSDSKLREKQDELKKRIEETIELERKEEMLKELQDLTEKLKKENLLDRAENLEKQAKQQERSLERILELTKQFYVERKAEQIIKKLKELAMSQNKLAKNESSTPKGQEDLNRKFDTLQNDIKQLREQNEQLKNPMDIPETINEENAIKDKMENAKNNLESKQKNSNQLKKEANMEAIKNQKSASKKIKELGDKMMKQMAQMEMESSEENMEDLRQILENLLIFSFDQESLMTSMEGINSGKSEYPSKLKQQQTLKEYFEHIDDSLFTLSMRLVQLTSKIDKHVRDAHYNLDKSLEAISENRIENGITHQRYTMTAANDLADMLSDVLKSLQNKKPGSGKGKGKNGETIELPDIIKKQENLIQKMKNGMPTEKSENGRSKEEMSGEQYQIYQEQKELRDQLNDLLRRGLIKGNEGKETTDKMLEIEKMLLDKGITEEVLRNMQNLNHDLLKLEKANYSQEKDNERKAEAGDLKDNDRYIQSIKSQKTFLDQNEMLIRNSLPFQPNFQDKVKNYFIDN